MEGFRCPRKTNSQTSFSNLHANAIDSRSINIDWQEARGEDGEGWWWRSYEASECDKCKVLVVLDAGQGDDEHRHCPGLDDEEAHADCMNHVPLAEGPMMNYWYPVEISDCTKAARKIADLPLCVVEFSGGTTGLALTGGGMDLSWEICEAFIKIGELPPVNFSRLPSMADKKLDKRNRLIIAACVKSNEIAIERARRNIEEIENTAKWMRRDARRRGK